MRYRDECMPLVSSVNTVYQVLFYYYDLCVAQLNNSNDFSPRFLCQKVIPCFLVLPSPCYKLDKKRVCNRASVCVLLPVPALLARVQTMSMCPNYHPRGRDAATRFAAVWVFLAK